MTKRSHGTSKSKPAPFREALIRFRRTVYSASNIRRGLTRARTEIPAEHIPTALRELLKDRLLAGHIVVNPFPADFQRFTNHLRLASVDADKEFLWTAAVLRNYSSEITQFASLKEQFERSLVAGKLDLAKQTLEDVNSRFGVSLWYLENLLQLVQLRDGLSAQKALFEAAISHRDVDIFAGLFGYYFSIRSEDNYSYNEIAQEATDLLDGGGLGDYALFHVIPYDLTKITHPAGVVSWEECRPIIDRYLAFVSMAKLQVARFGNEALPNFGRAVRLLDGITDPALNGLRRALGITHTRTEQHLDDLQYYDAYSEGKYETCLADIQPSVELTARASAMTGLGLSDPTLKGSLTEEIVSCMSQVLLVGPGYAAARARLKKLCLMCPRHAISIELAAFLERTHDNVSNGSEYTDLDRFTALSCTGVNPWHEDVLSSLSTPSSLFTDFPYSTSLRLREALRLPSDEANKVLDSLDIPDDRRTLYKGHVAMRRGAFDIASEFYKAALTSDKPFVVNRASAYLYRVLLANGETASALAVVVDHCLRNPSAYRLYPLEQLIEKIAPNRSLAGTISFAILLNIAARNISSKWERDISDAYESIMEKFCCDRPSKLVDQVAEIGESRLIYFLRHICIPRVFDDTIDFESVTEIDEERIAVCQRLIEIDPANKDQYAIEIKVITREANIYQALKKVESSKIFVDEAGIRSAVEATLKDAFERFQRLSRSPDLTYQVERISKLIGDLLSDNPAFDLKDLRLPASEREGLFGNMLSEFTTQFAINPAYGLDTHLSTTIRHGSFEGHIRSPLAVQDLLISKGELDDDYILPKKWADSFEGATSDEISEIKRALVKFTSRVQDQLDLYLRELLHVRGVDTHSKGLFNFLVTNEELLEFMKTIGEKTEYSEFVDRLFAFCWSSVEKSLSNIRNELRKGMLPAIVSAVNSLLTSTSNLSHLPGYSQFRDSIINGRTNVQAAIEMVSNWFRRPLDFTRDPFEFDLALDVARKQIANCYVQTSIEPSISPSIPRKIAGRFLDGMVEILFILLQNIIRHSGYETVPEDVTLDATEKDGMVYIKIGNRVADSVSISELQGLASEAAHNYQRDTAMKFARQEGGSGLSKIWRIVEYDFSVRHSIALEVSEENRRFEVELRLSDIIARDEVV